MKFGFIGTGNMSNAILTGMLNPDNSININKNKVNENKINSSDIFIYDINNETTEKMKEKYNINVSNCSFDVANNVDFLFLVVKPNIIQSVIAEIKDIVINKNLTIVSIASGKTIDFIESCFSAKVNIIRVMPNVNALILESMTALCKNDSASTLQLAVITDIFNNLGSTIIIEEKMFSAFTALAGSSPAYIYLLIDAMANAGVRAGFDKKTAISIAAQSVLGSAKTVLETKQHPRELIDIVCSPNGTTIEAMAVLQDNKFETAISKAIEAVIEKSLKQ